MIEAASQTNETQKRKASNQTAAIPVDVRVLLNFRCACKVLPALCMLGLAWRVLRGYCLSAVDDCLYCCCAAAHRSVGFFGGRRGRKQTNKQTTETVMMSSYWQQRGGGTAVRHGWCQIPSWQWNVSVVRGAKSSQWKVVSLVSVCLGPKDRGNEVGRVK